MGRYAELIQDWRQFIDITGISFDEFDHYLSAFQLAYDEIYPPGRSQPRRVGSQSERALDLLEDKLLFIWIYRQVKPDLAALGMQFGLTRSQTMRWVERLRPVLELAFAKLSRLDLPSESARFLQLLNQNEVEYLLVGGYAVALHGYLRPILDLDIFIATHTANAQRMVRVLEAFGEVSERAIEFFQMEERVIKIGQPPFYIERFNPNDRKIQLGSTPVHLEVITTISAVTFAECYPERTISLLNGIPVPVISLEHLKRNKQASNRSKDADDFAHLSQH